MLRRLPRMLQTYVPPSNGGVVILAYHLVGAGTASPVDLPEPEFRRQMEFLRRKADVVPLRRLGDRPRAPRARPRVVLTFDDAYRNFAERALPVLFDLGLPCTLFAPVGFVDGHAPPPISGTDGLPPMSWSALRDAVAAGGVEVGSHGWLHADVRSLDAAAAERELGDSRRRLEDELGVEVSSFCYPRGLWSARAAALVGRFYDLGVAAGGRRARPDRLRRLALPRVPVRSGDDPRFERLVGSTVWLEEWCADKVRRVAS